MPINPYFNFVSQQSEQNLVEDLIIEGIQIYGHSAYYIPRETADMDRLFGEDPLAKYEHAHEIELYLKSSTQFGGSGTMFSKFGLTVEDQVTFLMSMRRFNEVIPTMARPRENDIIYLDMFGPAFRYLFEIRYVNATEQLFQLGKLYTYELKCEIMNYSHERVTTSVPELNTVAEREAYTVKLSLDGTSGVGDYVVGEQVNQNQTTVYAFGRVVKWDKPTFTLYLQDVSGPPFVAGIPVTGLPSATVYTVLGENLHTVSDAPLNLEPTTLDIADNALLQTEAPAVLRPTANNPRYNE